MNQSSDFADLIHVFNAHRVEYVVVGAHALAAHGHVRATKDLDVWVHPTPANAQLREPPRNTSGSICKS